MSAIFAFPDGGTLTATLSPGAKSGVPGLGALVGKGADPTAISVAANINCLWKVIAHGKSAAVCVALRPDSDHGKAPYRTLMRDGTEMRGKVMLFGHWDNECEIPIHIAKAGKRLQRCTHYLNGLPPVGAGIERRAGIRMTEKVNNMPLR